MATYSSTNWDFARSLSDWICAALEYDKASSQKNKVDGCIIGTGQSDFTQGNTAYLLNHKGKTFQLIDVPGIEGNENKYERTIEQAIAKAHLVFYVIEIKKLEKPTAEKMRRYLQRGTHVCPIVNVRGQADSYEFEEDRAKLVSGQIAESLQQNTQVLEAALGKEVLLDGLCVQGLLAFSSLAFDATANSTIHYKRNTDLGRQQQNYLKCFGTTTAMRRFSGIDNFVDVLDKKQATFKQDIIESNKGKLKKLLTETIRILSTMREEHQKFAQKLEPEFAKCRHFIEDALIVFEENTQRGSRSKWESLFDTLEEKTADIVKEHFGDNERIKDEIEKTWERQKKSIASELEKRLEDDLNHLQNAVQEATKRLVQDVKRVQYQTQLEDFHSQINYAYSSVDMDLSFKDWGGIAFTIGQYAATGFGIGSVFPIVGNAIGAIAGAVVGVLISLAQFFSSEEERIRKAQKQVQEQLNDLRQKVLKGLPEHSQNLIKSIQQQVKRKVGEDVDSLHQQMIDMPFQIIDHKILTLQEIKQKLEDMPHGSIRAI